MGIWNSINKIDWSIVTLLSGHLMAISFTIARWILGNLANIVLAIATIVLAVATISMARSTRKYTKISQDILKNSEEAFQESLRPYITIKTDIDPASRTICLKISNTGKTSAKSLRLNVDKTFCPIDTKRGKNDELISFQKKALNEAYLFKNGIQTFSPGQEVIFYLGEAHYIFDDDKFRETTPLQFSITAEYNYQKNKKASEPTVIDLEVYRSSQLEPLGRTIKGLQGIENAIRTLKK